MTWREAVAQAYRELGASEEAIARHARHADSQNLGFVQLTKAEIEPGKERETVERLKALFRRLALLSPAQYKALQQEAQKRGARHNSKQ